jgi:pimeloyl-ACP methyl ester carboxylesterase
MSKMSSDPTLVNVGTHSLALYTHGPQPKSTSEPVVFFVAGVCSSHLVWSGVLSRLPTTLRSYTYDRAGYSKSEISPVEPTAENTALDLLRLIKHAPILNPLILVGHSWAGVIINELLALTGTSLDIAGLVLVDANHETALQVLNPNNPNLAAISEGVEHYRAKGISNEHKLTREEWDDFVADESGEKYLAQAQKEDDAYVPSFETLQKKELAMRQPLLGNKPVYIIGGLRSQDWTRMLKAGMARGNGTEEQKKNVEELIKTADKKSEGLMREHLKLSTKSKLVIAGKSGHFVQLTEPELVVDGVEWVLDNLSTS